MQRLWTIPLCPTSPLHTDGVQGDGAVMTHDSPRSTEHSLGLDSGECLCTIPAVQASSYPGSHGSAASSSLTPGPRSFPSILDLEPQCVPSPASFSQSCVGDSSLFLNYSCLLRADIYMECLFPTRLLEATDSANLEMAKRCALLAPRPSETSPCLRSRTIQLDGLDIEEEP